MPHYWDYRCTALRSFCMDTVYEHGALLNWHSFYQLSYYSRLRTEITENNLIQLRLCRWLSNLLQTSWCTFTSAAQHLELLGWDMYSWRRHEQTLWTEILVQSLKDSTSIFTHANLSHWSNYISKFINRSNFLLEKWYFKKCDEIKTKNYIPSFSMLITNFEYLRIL